MQDGSKLQSENRAARIGPLSVLPVFFDLAGKRAVVAGGSEAAAWKAELLAAAGAQVEVHAPREGLSDGMREFLERCASVSHCAARWSPASLAGAAVALADAEDETEAAAFERAARAAGTACNVIDKPAFCHFQFGSIVNRSPVVIGISTSGAAPVLGQAIRRRIEALLPASLAQWAALARDVRGLVVERLSHGPRRRVFWERFVDRAFGPAPEAAAKVELAALVADGGATLPAATVTLIAASAGDAELLTLKAVRALQGADVILHDGEGLDEILELARREARRLRMTGKDAGGAAAQVAALAEPGRRIVRLVSAGHSGHGSIRAEAAALVVAGILPEVVPMARPLPPLASVPPLSARAGAGGGLRPLRVLHACRDYA